MGRAFRGPITRFITLPGEVKAYQEAMLCAKVAGYLKTIPVDKGDQVKAGGLIAELEVPELQADLARGKAEVEVAELEYRRLNDSSKKAPDLVIPQAVDNARAKLDVAKATVEKTEALLRYAHIIAPFDGTITRRMVDPGAFIPAAAAGAASQNSAIVTLADFARVRVQVAVPEVEAPLIKQGLSVKVMSEGLASKTFDGTITRFSYALDEATRTMLMEAELPNPQLELRPGMYATVRIGIEHKEDALLVPAEAVLTEKSGSSVFVPADGKAKKTRVQTGFNDGSNVEIVSGLKADDPIVLFGKRSLVDGQPISAVENK
jgi:RND family efflux transporter MFP subunit